MRRFVIVLFGMAACGGDDDDGSAVVDAAESSTDADLTCGAGEMCLLVAPVDGVTPPAGRIVVAWQPASGSTWSIAYDRPWTSQAVTRVPLSDIPAPAAQWQFDGPCGAGVAFGSATVILSTDPDGSGGITSTEIASGYATGETYGIHQEIVTWSDAGCGPTSSLPQGLDAGVHVYTRTAPVTKKDGRITELQTCSPRSPACQQISNPF